MISDWMPRLCSVWPAPLGVLPVAEAAGGIPARLTRQRPMQSAVIQWMQSIFFGEPQKHHPPFVRQVESDAPIVADDCGWPPKEQSAKCPDDMLKNKDPALGLRTNGIRRK